MSNINNNKLAVFSACSFCVFALSADLYAKNLGSSGRFRNRFSGVQQMAEIDSSISKDKKMVMEEDNNVDNTDEDIRQLREERKRILQTIERNNEAEKQQRLEAESRKERRKQEEERENKKIDEKLKLVEENCKLTQKMEEEQKRMLEDRNNRYKQEIGEYRAAKEKLSLKTAKLTEEKKRGLEEKNRRAEELRKLAEESVNLEQQMKEIAGQTSGLSLSSSADSPETASIPSRKLSLREFPASTHSDEAPSTEQMTALEQLKTEAQEDHEEKKAAYSREIRKRVREMEEESQLDK